MFARSALLFAFSFVSTFAIAEDVRTVRVAFNDGRATVKGVIKGYETVDYMFPAGAGESIRIHFAGSKGLSNYFNLTAPGATEARHVGSSSGDSFDGVATVAGEYTARVYLMRNDARRNKVARYTMAIQVGQKVAANERGPDFADGLSGGPDYWEVAGVPAGDTLSLRASASPKARVVTRVANGAALRNLGCKFTRGQRWCRVEDGSSHKGWANGKYLREGAGPGQ